MRLIDADAIQIPSTSVDMFENCRNCKLLDEEQVREIINNAPSIDIVRCQDCKKSHIDGKTTHYLWCIEWGRSTDTFGYCERGEREGE